MALNYPMIEIPANQKKALAGTDGPPGDANRYVVNNDVRLSPATQLQNGLLSAADKLKLDGIENGAVADHTHLTNRGTNTHAQIDTHISTTNIHTPLNDSITTTSNTWSADKIQSTVNTGVINLVSLNALKFRYYADQLDFPRTTDWAVNVGAPSARDTTNAALTVRRFDSTVEEGVGLTVVFPLLATNMLVRIKAKAASSPGGSRGIVWKLYWRRFPDGAAATAWSSLVLPTMTIPNDTYMHYYSYTASLPTWGITAGDLTQFELTRVGSNAADTLTVDACLAAFEMEFS